MRFLYRLIVEDDGFITSPEWAFVATILVLGAITGTLISRQMAERDAQRPAIVQGR